MDEAGYDAALIEIDGLLRAGELDAEQDRRLDELFDEVEAYEHEHVEIPDAPPSDVLRLLMESNRLTAEDVAARSGIAVHPIGDILRGEVVPTLAQAIAFGKAFHVRPAVFWDREAMEDQVDTRERSPDEISAGCGMPLEELKAALGLEPNEETAQALREAGEGKNLMGPYATADEMFDAFDATQAMETRRERAEIACRELQEEIDAGEKPPDRMRPELRQKFEERWERDEPGYRFLADR